jgi:ferredoxin--NADP+ reductase
MNEILVKEVFSPDVKYMEVHTPDIARKAQAGQFVILRVSEEGERIPLTIADYDSDRGTIQLVVQEVGKTTKDLGQLEVGDRILDLIGPLGHPSEIEQYGTVVCVGGGIGIAPIYPIARALREAGNKVISIIGARNKDLIFWEDKMRTVSDALTVTTDDGSYGRHGLVTQPLKELLDAPDPVHLVFAIGPAIMMKFVAKTTEPYHVKTLVSLNSIMIDGTGMCGGCRVSIDGRTRFVCVDGPDFDAHQVDFDLLMARQRIYKEEEETSLHRCKLEEHLS